MGVTGSTAKIAKTSRNTARQSMNLTAKPPAPTPNGGPSPSAVQPIDQSQIHWNSSQPMSREEHESLANIHASKLSILCLELVETLRKQRYQVAGQTLRTVNLEVNLLAGHVAKLIS